MKTLLLLAFSTIAVAPLARAADQDQVKHPNKHQTQVTRHTATTQTPKIQRSATVRQYNHVNRSPHINPVTRIESPRVRSQLNQNVTRVNEYNRTSEFRPPVVAHQKVVKPPVPANSNWANSNWDRNHRHHHDRGWWRSRYNRFVIFGGGYYYWDNNYWYPAYGYDSRYNTYSYDEPIYGYQDMAPGQVIANVQRELQRLGYYRYAVDGLMGPATRAAIANFQRDNNLAITSAIDRRTLQSLGLG